jgi:DNA (cytosine-5)-methyltransferase 1
MRYLSVCSGIEAASVAWKPLGWECAGVSEIDKFPRAVLEHRLGAVPVDDDHRWQPGQNFTPLFGDFTKIEEHHVGPVDLLVGGTPCQSFSIAGKRLGLDDPRGNLALEYLALAKRVCARWICWENVPGVLSHDEGRTFGTFLGFVEQCGFRWAYRVIDAQYARVGRFGRAVPQRRRRVFLIGYSGTADINPAAVLFDRESLRGNPAPRRQAGQRAAPTLAARTRGGGGLGTDFDCDGGLIAAFDKQAIGEYGNGETSSTCAARDFKDATDLVAHSLRAEGFDAGEDGTGRGTPIVPVQAIRFSTQQEPKWADGVCPTLTVPSKSGGGQPHCVAFSAKDSGADAAEEVSPTLRAGGHAGSHANAGVMPAVAFAQNTRDEVRIQGDGQISGALAAEPGMKQQTYLAAAWGVRRLTPTECERLQGFPDGWTAIPWRGKDASVCPDGPRYKALGNSMAVNVMCWIGERIATIAELENTANKAA